MTRIATNAWRCFSRFWRHEITSLQVDRVLDILTDKLSAAKDQSENGNQAVMYELERMIGMTERSVKYIDAYRSHVVRWVIDNTH